MVRINFAVLLVATFGAVIAAGASIHNLEIQARSAELTALVEARDVAYLEYKAREVDLRKRASELEARGFDAEELQVLFRRAPLNSSYKKKVIEWLEQADGEFHFGIKTFNKMHSGTTSREPHCRPWALRRTDTINVPKTRTTKATTRQEYVYVVALYCKTSDDKDLEVVKPFVIDRTPIEGGVQPTAKVVYNAFKAKVEEM